MAQEIGALRALLTATSAVFERDMKAARDSVHRHGTSMQRAMADIGKRFTAATVALAKYASVAAGAAVTGFAYFIKKQIDAADAIGKMAQQTGTSTEFLSAMGFVAEQTGTSLNTIATSVQRLSRYMSDAARGTGEARHAFELLNVSVVDAGGSLRNAEDVLLEIAGKFKGLEDGSEKTALAMQLFGRAGAEIIPMLNQGEDGLRRFMERAKEMGLVISQDTANQAAMLNDQLNVLKNQAVGFGREVMVSVLPTLNEAVKVIREAHEESGLLTAAWVGLAYVWSRTFGGPAREIRKIDAEIEKLQGRIEELNRIGKSEDWGDFAWTGAATGKIEAELFKLQKRREELQSQLDTEAEEEKKRLDEAIARMREEVAQRERNTAALRKDAEERAKIKKATAEAEAEEKARIRAAEAATAAIESQIRALEIQRDTFNMTTREATLYKLTLMEGVTPAQIELADSILKSIEAMEEQKNGFKEVSKEVDKTEDRFKELQRTIEGWGRQSASAIADFAVDGSRSFSDLANSIIKDMIAMLVYQQMLKPIFGAIGGAFTGGGGTSAFNFSTGPAVNMPGRASGGSVAPFQRYVVGERGPEVIQMGGRGGYVHPSLASGAMGSIENNIIIKGGQPKVSEQQNATGGKDIEIVFEQMMANKLGQRGSQPNRVLRQTYGAREGLVNR